MIKLISIFYIIGLLLASPMRSMCRNSPECELGASVVEQMNLQVAAGDKLDPVLLRGSIAFVQECPAAVLPAFTRFATDEPNLHDSWLKALKSGAETRADSELRAFLAAAKESVDHNGNPALKKFLDGILDVPVNDHDSPRVPVGRLYEHQSLAVLRQFPHCEAAECYAVSDFLLFLLAAHPSAFFGAMRADEPDATKWLSQLGDLSFAGDTSDRKQRNAIKRFLMERVSNSKAREFGREKAQVENALREIHFRGWN